MSSAAAANSADSSASEPSSQEQEARPKPNQDESTGQDDLSMMKKVLMESQVSDGAGTKNSVWGMTLETFGMADGGKHQKSDIFVDSVELGLERLKECMAQQRRQQDSTTSDPQAQGAASDAEGVPSWTKLVPFLNEFRATPDQLLIAFLKWSEQRVEDNSDSLTKKVNVSRAHRRVTSYLEWMEQNAKEFEEPLTVESISPAAEIWDIQMSYDQQGHFIWWINLGDLDKSEIQKLEPRDHLRYMVWFSHVVMFDPNAQENGAIFIQDFGSISFWKFVTLVPPHLGAKIDRLTIGILPIQMKKLYMFGVSRWMSLFVGLIKPFLSQKMRERIVVVPRTSEIQSFCDELVNRKNIPQGFGGLEGEAPRDLHFQRFNS